MTKKRKKNSRKNSALKVPDSFSGSFKYISDSNFFKSKVLNYWLQWSNGYDSGLWKTFRKSFIKNFADILGSGFDSRLRPTNSESELVHL